jgi:hypothetical protein
MCLKPHFMLLPLAVTLLDCLEARSFRPALSVANAVFAGVGLAYVGLVRVLHPAYLADILPLALDVYGAYGKPFPEVLSGIAAPLGIVVLWVLLMCRSHLPDRPARVFLALAAAGLATYFLQGTGFSYHKVPFLAFGTMAAVLTLIAGALPRAPALAAAAVIAIAGWTGLRQGFYRNEALSEVKAAVSGLAGIGSVMALSSHVYTGPPVAMALGADWASTYPADWLVPGAVNGLLRTDCAAEPGTCGRLQAAIERNRKANVADLVRLRPDLVIVDRSSGYFLERRFDWLDFMAGDPGWPPAFASYRKVAESGRFLYFLRQAE